MAYQVFIRYNDKNKIILTVATSKEDFNKTTIKELKEKLILENPRAPEPDKIRVIFGTEQLEDEKTLGFYKITHASTLIFVMRMDGGRGERHTIYVKTLNGKTITPVDVDPEELENMSVREFRRRIDRFDPPSHCRLVYRGRDLEDHRTLLDCGVINESTLNMTGHLSGGERRTIHVRTDIGRPISVDVDSEELENMTIGEFRRRVDSQKETWRLLFKHRELENHRTLRDYGIKHESTVHMIMSMPGGGSIPPRGFMEIQPPPEDENKVLPRTESMEVLYAPPMQQPESSGGAYSK